MKKIYFSFILSCLLFTIFYLSACVSITKQPSTSTIPQIPLEIQAQEIASGDSWQTQWGFALKEGKKEGKVVIYSTQTSNTMRQAITKAAKDKFGIELDIVVGKGAELTSKILTERNANLFLVDVWFGGPSTPLFDLKPEGFLSPLEPFLILPEVIGLKYWEGGKLGWVDKDHYVILMFGSVAVPIAINTSIVKYSEITSYYDLLNPKWKGKIIMEDPTIAGKGSDGFAILSEAILNLDFFYQLAKQEPVIIRDRRLQVEWLARGKYPVNLFPHDGIIQEFREIGMPISNIVPKEGTWLSSGGGGIALFNKAPHPNAARVFVNWILSQEGQTIICNVRGYPSRRIDVKVENLDPTQQRQEGVKYFLDGDTEEWQKKQVENRKIAEKIFATFIMK